MTSSTATPATCGCRSNSRSRRALEIEAPDGGRWAATTAAIPVIDPRKDIPKS